LEENAAAFLCYIFGFITGIVFLLVEKESDFVRFHARQSTITFLGLLVIYLILAMIPIVNLLVFPLSIVILILWLVLMVKALKGERYHLPIVGRMVEEKTKG